MRSPILFVFLVLASVYGGLYVRADQVEEAPASVSNRAGGKAQEDQTYPLQVLDIVSTGAVASGKLGGINVSIRETGTLPAVTGYVLIYGINASTPMSEIAQTIIKESPSWIQEECNGVFAQRHVGPDNVLAIHGVYGLETSVPEQLAVKLDDVVVTGPLPLKVQLWSLSKGNWNPVSAVFEKSLGAQSTGKEPSAEPESGTQRKEKPRDVGNRLRKWSDSTGKYSVEAEFLNFEDGEVHLKKKDGKAITVPIERLSEADRDFVKSQAAAPKSAESATNDEQRAEHMGTGIPDAKLEVKYSGMKETQVEDFSSSMAVWIHDAFLVLLFRNYNAPLTRYETPPPPGKASLIVPVRKYKLIEGVAHGLEPVASGSYDTAGGVLISGRIHFGEANVLSHREHPGLEVELGAVWRVNKDGNTKFHLWHDDTGDPPPFLEMVNLLTSLGTVKLTSLGREPGSRVIGELNLGKDKGTYRARGNFDIPVVEKPSDYEEYMPKAK